MVFVQMCAILFWNTRAAEKISLDMSNDEYSLDYIIAINSELPLISAKYRRYVKVCIISSIITLLIFLLNAMLHALIDVIHVILVQSCGINTDHFVFNKARSFGQHDHA